MAPKANLLSLLYQALASQVGIECEVSDFALGRQQLYSARRQAGDPSLACLQLRQHPRNANLLWIVKGPSPNEQA